MKILFSTFGSLGDLHPYLALALEAKARGHAPVIATSERYRPKVEALGLEFRAVAPDLPPDGEFGDFAKRVMNERDGPRFLFEELLSPTIRAAYADLLEASADADVMITHPAALAGPLVARKLGKRWLASVLAPISLWSRRDPATPPTMPHLDWLRVFGPLWGAVQVRAGERVTRPWVAAVERLRADEGLENAGHPMFAGQFSPYGNLALFSRHFCAPQSDWPAHTKATGFCFYDAQGLKAPDAGQDWREWMADGPPPVVWTLGSSAVHDAGSFYTDGAEDCLESGRRALLIAGENAAQLRGAYSEEQVLVLDYAPYSEVFPLAACVVHQGGIGTTAQALRAGVPQIIAPFAHDQPDHAARITRLGLGFSLRKHPNRAVQTLFENYEALSHHAVCIGERMRWEDGPRAACEVIEKLMERQHSTP